jgi:transketolase
VHLALEATKQLETQGVSVKLLDMHTIKPIDREAVVECLELGRIITVEDHNILNGLGSAVSEVVAEEGKGKVKRIGVQDQFGQSAPYEKLLELNGITVENIVRTANEML